MTGGTDNHLFLLLDLSPGSPFSGKDLQEKLDEEGLPLNKNCVPGETRSPERNQRRKNRYRADDDERLQRRRFSEGSPQNRQV